MAMWHVIWLASLVIQGYAVWIVILELRSPYAFRLWYWKWGLMGAAMSLMLFWRLSNVLWMAVDIPWVTFNKIVQDVYVSFAVSVCLALSLRHARLLYSPIAPLAPAAPAIIFIDTNSTILSWNVQATMLFGWRQEEALGQNLAALIIPEYLRQAHLEGLQRWLESPPAQRRLDAQYLTVACHKSGYEFRVEVVITYVEHQDGSIQFHGSVRKLIPV